MSEHLSEQDVELYRRRAADPAERRRADAHLGACEDCLRRVLDSEHESLAFAALTEAFLPAADEEPFHLSAVELRDYLAGSLDEADRVVCESHLEVCARCEADARALASRPPDLASAAPDLAPAPANVQTDSGPPSLNSGQPSFQESPAPAWRLPRLPAPVWATAAIALVACLSLAALLSYRRGAFTTRVQIAQTGPDETRPAPASEGLAPTEARTEAGAPSDSRGDDDRAGAVERQPGIEEAERSGTEGERAGVAEGGGAAESPPVIRLKDEDGEVKLDGRGRLTGLEGVSATTRRAVEGVLASGHLPQPQDLAALSAPAITLLDGGAGEMGFELTSPLGVVVGEDRPTLRWRPVGGAASYTVAVFDAEYNRVASSAPQTATEWTPPSPLRRGRVYSWEVVALKDSREITAPVAPAPRAQFKILEAEKLEELAALRRRRPVSHLALGVTYARFGLPGEAEREFRKLAQDNPRSPLVRKLLRTVRAWQKKQ